jgi:dolichyl-phosphate-mannose-protein mannosyltransferase
MALAMRKKTAAKAQDPAASVVSPWPAGYLLLSFLAGWLPWAFIGRCQFVYLYMPSLAFAIIASALGASWLIARGTTAWRNSGYAVVALIIGCFLYFLPIFMALPISPAGFHARMWLRSWI